MSDTAVLIPVKAFTAGKARLAPVLAPDERADLARRMATTVVEAARPLPVAVVCDDDAVATWARAERVEVIWRPGRGLNPAVTDGVAHLAAAGYEKVIVAHADLPHATDLAGVADFDGITLVPDRREDGTNVLALPATCGFAFSYGPGSFARHRAEAARLGLPCRVERVARLGWDVDIPDDLAQPAWLGSGE